MENQVSVKEVIADIITAVSKNNLDNFAFSTIVYDQEVSFSVAPVSKEE